MGALSSTLRAENKPTASDNKIPRLTQVDVFLRNDLPGFIQVDTRRATIDLPSNTSSEELKETLIQHALKKTTKDDKGTKLSLCMLIRKYPFRGDIDAARGSTLESFPRAEDGVVLAEIIIARATVEVVEPNITAPVHFMTELQDDGATAASEKHLLEDLGNYQDTAESNLASDYSIISRKRLRASSNEVQSGEYKRNKSPATLKLGNRSPERRQSPRSHSPLSTKKDDADKLESMDSWMRRSNRIKKTSSDYDYIDSWKYVEVNFVSMISQPKKWVPVRIPFEPSDTHDKIEAEIVSALNKKLVPSYLTHLIFFEITLGTSKHQEAITKDKPLDKYPGGDGPDMYATVRVWFVNPMDHGWLDHITTHGEVLRWGRDLAASGKISAPPDVSLCHRELEEARLWAEELEYHICHPPV